MLFFFFSKTTTTKLFLHGKGAFEIVIKFSKCLSSSIVIYYYCQAMHAAHNFHVLYFHMTGGIVGVFTAASPQTCE